MITGVTHPTTGKKDKIKIEMVNTDCHNVLRKASLMPRAMSFINCRKLNGKSRFSMIDSVFSLRYANTGEPMMRKRYLNREK